MTREQADRFADALLKIPSIWEEQIEVIDDHKKWTTFASRLFIGGAGLSSSLPWIRMYSKFSLSNAGVVGGYNPVCFFWCADGFGPEYEKPISDWLYSRPGAHPRYVNTLDLLMFAAVGMEYARKKLIGFRWLCDVNYWPGGQGITRKMQRPQDFPKGCIVRISDGSRWAHRVDGMSSLPPSRDAWTPLVRFGRFSAVTSDAIELTDEFEYVTDFNTPVSGTSMIGEIEGNNDLVTIPENTIRVYEYPIGTSTGAYKTEVGAGRLSVKGDMQIYLSTRNNINFEDEIIEDNGVMLASAAGWWMLKLKNAKDGTIEWWDTPADDQTIEGERHIPRFRSNYIPLKKGIKYYVYMKRNGNTSGGDFKVPNNPKFEIPILRVSTTSVAPCL